MATKNAQMGTTLNHSLVHAALVYYQANTAEVVFECELHSTVKVTHVYHMGNLVRDYTWVRCSCGAWLPILGTCPDCG